MKKGESGSFSGMRAFVRRNWIAIRSCLIFTAALAVWLAWYPRLVGIHALDRLLELDAQLTGSALGILGNQIDVNGTFVSSFDFSMRIGHECTAIVPMVILLCAVVAYPSQIKQKLLCLAFGLTVLFLLNLVRTVTLFYVGVHIPAFFDTAHFVVWQSAMILAVVALWLFWVGRLVNARSA